VAREPIGGNENGPPAGVLAPAAAQEPPSLTDEVEEEPGPVAPPPGIATEPAAEEVTGGLAVELPNEAAPPEPAETAADNETNTAPAEPVVIPEPTAADEPATAPEANELAAAPAPPAPIAGAGPAPAATALAAPEPGPAPAEVEAGRPNLTTTPGQEALEADAQLAFEAQQQDSRTSEPDTGSVIDLFIR
jgi:nicotinate-nucleotide--dimethylbenzimidazole phosphoribosyltransferase